jgi:hypothetical protein
VWPDWDSNGREVFTMVESVSSISYLYLRQLSHSTAAACQVGGRCCHGAIVLDRDWSRGGTSGTWVWDKTKDKETGQEHCCQGLGRLFVRLSQG